MHVVWIHIAHQLEAGRWLCDQNIAFNTVNTKQFVPGKFYLWPEIGYCFPNESDGVLFALRWA